MISHYGLYRKSLGFRPHGKFGHVPDPPDPPECKERFIEEYCQDCSDYEQCKAEYDRLVGDDDADN